MCRVESLACASHPPLLLPSVSQALQCYSFQHIYFGPFDLSGMKLPNISCPYGCSEAILSLDTGEGQGSGKKGGVQKRKGWGQGLEGQEEKEGEREKRRGGLRLEGAGGERRERQRRGRGRSGAPAPPRARRVPRLGDPGAEGLLDRPVRGPDAVQRGSAAARLLGDSRLLDRLVQR